MQSRKSRATKLLPSEGFQDKETIQKGVLEDNEEKLWTAATNINRLF